MTRTAPLPLPPGPRGALEVLSTLRRFRASPLDMLDEMRARHGDIVSLQVGWNRFVLLGDPAAARRLLVDNAENYFKGWTYDPLRDVLGDGLLTSNGEKWRRNRRLIQPAFQRMGLQRLAAIMVDCVERVGARWSEIAGSGRPVDLVEEMMHLALDVSTRTMLGTGFADANRRRIVEAVHTAVVEANYRLTRPIRYSLPFPTFAKRRLRRSIRALDDVIYGVIDRRLADPGPRDDAPDALGAIMSARHADTGVGLTRKELRDELVTLFIAGYESTSVALCWMWVFLDRNPAVRARLEEDVASAGAPFTPDAARARPYANAVVKESLRLMPPAWLFGQDAREDDEMGGYRIPKGACVMISPYLLHRDERHWPGALRFEPERWLDEAREAARPSYAYLPFSGGGRTCIGNHFAVMEMLIALVKLGGRFRVEVLPDPPVVPLPLSTVGFKHGLRARIAGGRSP